MIVHYGQSYVHEVRSVKEFMQAGETERTLQHEDYPWLTLITCMGYDEESDAYRWRVVVQAVQVRIE